MYVEFNSRGKSVRETRQTELLTTKGMFFFIFSFNPIALHIAQDM